MISKINRKKIQKKLKIEKIRKKLGKNVKILGEICGKNWYESMQRSKNLCVDAKT